MFKKELRYAREIALEKPEEAIFLIPLRLDECEVPRGLRFYQWVDYFGERKNEGYDSLVESLQLRYEQKLRLEQEEGSRQEKSRKEREEAEKVARENAEKDVAEKARLKAEEQARQKAIKDQAEREAAEKTAHEKAEKEAAEKTRLKAVEEERQRLVQEKVGREIVEKATREKVAHEREKSDANTKAKRESAEKERSKDTPVFPEEKLNKSLKSKIEKPGIRKTNISSKTSVIVAISIIGLVGVVCVALLGWAIAGNFPLATATPVVNLPPTRTSTSRPNPTSTLMLTPTSFPTRTPDYLSGSEILFATKDGKLYSYKKDSYSEIGLISLPDEWNSESTILGRYTWSWNASKDTFIVQGVHTNRDVHFIDRSGQEILSLEIPYTNYCPNLSPDGNKIAVMSQAVTNGNLWVFNNDGSNFIRLSPSSGMQFGCPSWSPDGKSIAAGAIDSTGISIVILDLAGAVTKQIEIPGSFRWFPPHWSADSKSLIVCDEDGIYKLGLENGENSQLIDVGVVECDWSPDGKFGVFITSAGLNIIDIDTHAVLNLLGMEDIVSVAWK